MFIQNGKKEKKKEKEKEEEKKRKEKVKKKKNKKRNVKRRLSLICVCVHAYTRECTYIHCVRGWGGEEVRVCVCECVYAGLFF